jgi:hypothetical protein
MKIIRTLWGDLDFTKREVSNKCKFDNEVVYVWGIDNETYLRELGYDTILISEKSADDRYPSLLTKYMHKLLAIERADEEFGEYILLDWDTVLKNEIDDEFYSLLRSRGKIQCPLYCLPNNFYDIITEEDLSAEMNIYFDTQNSFIKQYSWRYENLNVIPNFSFFYSNNAKIGKELIKLALDNNLKTNIEEFSLFIWANCSIEEWISNYEPMVCVGQEKDVLKEVSNGLFKLNTYIGNILEKKIYITHKHKIKIIRALWGNSLYILNEIPKKPIFEDELVYIWGRTNYEFLSKKLNYNCILVNQYIAEEGKYDTHLNHFGHKLEVLKLADERYGEYLFLDWDVTTLKPIDDMFFDIIRSGNNLQCPLYAYHSNYRNDAIDYHTKKSDFTENLDDFLLTHINQLEKYHWKHEDIKVLPCFCFLYSNNTNIGSDLLNIMNENGILACIEEFAMQLYSDCSLDEYISKYEPIVIRGKERDKNLEGMTLAIQKINNYINTKIDKNVYLIHDLN